MRRSALALAGFLTLLVACDDSKVDRTPPEISVTGVADGQFSNAEHLVVGFSATDENAVTLNATLNGEPIESGTSVSAEGAHTLQVDASDEAGNTAQMIVGFTLDRVAPEVSISGVAEGALVGPPVTLRFSASDDHLESVEATLDGAAFTSGEEVTEAGEHTLVVVAKDKAGNATEAVRHFTIDLSVSSVAFITPEPLHYTSAQSVEVVAATTGLGEVVSVVVGEVGLLRSEDGLYRGMVPLQEGANELTLLATWADGSTRSASQRVYRDSTPPQLTVSAPTEGQSLTTFELSVEGRVQDASPVTVNVNGQVVEVTAEGAFTHALTLIEGPNTVTVEATDRAGNVEAVTRTVQVEVPAPTLRVSEPAAGFTTSESSVVVKGTATSALPGESLTLTVAGMETPVDPQGGFQRSVSLAMGSNTIEVRVVDPRGKSAEQHLLGTRTELEEDGGTGEPDGGTSDGGTPDGGSPDGGASDAGDETDAGTPDPSEPLELSLDSPTDALMTNGATVAVSGRISGGTAPFSVTVGSVAASVSGRSFGLALPLDEGAHTLTVQVSDASGRIESLERRVTVDRTKPFLTITRPEAGTTEVAESPYRFEGEVGDLHLAGVTVQGIAANVIAGKYSAYVTLPSGESRVTVVATDLAGNRAELIRTLTINGAPPVVTILEPFSGSEAETPVVHVRAQVTAHAPLASVQIGTGTADEVAPDVYAADVPLSLGDNTLTVTATDVMGLRGTSSVQVRFRDPGTEPLRVTGVSPSSGEADVTPDSLISVSFNKAVAPNSLAGHFEVLRDGEPLAGGHSLAPGGQTATFIAKAPLPEGARLTVRVRDLQALVGPAQSETFLSEFDVRRPLTRVRGVVTDESFRPLQGVLVTLEGEGVSTRTGPDGNWALVGIRGGDSVIRYEGGRSSDGRSMATVRRRVFLTPEAETVDSLLTLTPTDGASAQQVVSDAAVHLTFNGRHGALGLDLPANGLTFESGLTQGSLAATRLEPYAIPVPLSGGFGLTGVWQLAPAGTRLLEAAEFQFPNLTGLPAGRRALLFAYDPNLHVIQHVAFGTVTPDGAAIRSDSPVAASSVEYLGYLGLSEAQHQAVEDALATSGGMNGGDTQGLPDETIQGMLNPQPRPLWKRMLNGVLGEARAQGLLGSQFGLALGALQNAVENSVPAAVNGVVRAPREQQLSIDVLSPAPEVLVGQHEVSDAPFQISMGFKVQQELGELLSEGGGDPVRLELAVHNPDGTPQGPQSGVEWMAEGEGSASLYPALVLREGVTRITVSAKLGTTLSRSTRIEAKLERLPEDAAVLPPFPGTPSPEPGANRFQLTIRRTFDSAEDGDNAFQSLVRFRDLKVTVTGPGSGWSGVTGETGGYGIPIPTPMGTQHGISCAELPLGTRPVAIVDGESRTGVRTELVSADFPSCSPSYTVSPGSTVRADILFDVRLLKGALTFVDRQGVPLPLTCDGTGTEWDPETGDVVRLDSQHVTSTEVHFFREDNLELPIARYTVAASRPEACGAPPEANEAHGHYARIRPGPATPTKQNQRIRCAEVLSEYGGNVPPRSSSSAEDVSFYWSQCVDNRVDFLRLSPGDRIVAVAVNHATGHTGLARVVVSPISRIARDPEGKCPADEAAGGLLEIIEHGEKVLVSRCAEAEVAIRGDVKLFPPEVDVRITRRAPEEGLRRDAMPMSVRQGGAATNRDDYVQVSTHWRVRTRAPGAAVPGDAPTVEGCTSGSSGEACAPGMLVDTGEAGRRLEVFCSELPVEASEVQRANCLPDDLELTDVPVGVPPLAGQLVRVTGAAVEQPAVVAFQVKPGRGSAAVHPSMKVKDSQGSIVTLNNLTRASYYLHVVGQQVFPRDTNGDERLSPEELLASPPDFSWDPSRDPLGRPTQAVQLKNVYRSLEPDGTRVERYDLSREHEFRVLDLLPPTIVAGGASGQRPLSDEEQPAAQESDLSYQFFAALMDVPPEDRGRSDVTPGEYVVRIGSDAYGIECPLQVVEDGDSRLITAECEGEFLPEILAASDLLYIELYLSGNADNILYRFNFYGLAPRYDHLPSGSAYTAERSVEVYQGRPVKDRTFSQPALGTFAVEPGELTQGQLRICDDERCTGEVLKQANLSLLPDGSFDVSMVPPEGGVEHRGGELVQLGEPGVHGARRFSMAVPADFGEMPGVFNPQAEPLYLVLDSAYPTPKRTVRVLGKPKGVFVGANAYAPGQESLEGINVADGHLTFKHEDFAVPHYAETVRFVRTYNNQRNLLSPLGFGWNHNYEGEVLEEGLGRYTVLLNGQSHDFPECIEIDAESHSAWSCRTDASHGLTLDVRSSGGAWDVTMRTAHGWTYKFDREALRGDRDGRRRWLLTRYEDGHGRDENGELLGWTHLEYEENSNRVLAVERRPGALRVEFTYEPISEDPGVSIRLKQLARTENFKRLASVKLMRRGGQGGGSVLHQVDFTHDPKNLNLEAADRSTDLTEVPPLTDGIDTGEVTFGPTSQRWAYAYASVPSDVSGNEAWALANEVSTASLLVNGSRQWTATYTRNAGDPVYPHVHPREFVTSVIGTGHPDVPLVITPSGERTRRIQRPDGVELRVELNAYGNLSKMEFVGGGELTKYDWESDNRARSAGSDRGGRVYPLMTESPTGLAVVQTPDEKLRTDTTQVQELPTSGLPIPGVAANTTLSRIDSRDGLGRPTQSAFLSGEGLATAATPRNPQGDITSFQLDDVNGETLLAVASEVDADGVALSGTDAAGNRVTYGGFDQQPLHLPTTATVTHPSSVTGALGSFVEHLSYDAYGRRIRSENVTTGRIEEWNYDGLGRLRWRRLNSVPVQVWSYQYAHSSDQVTVTERLNGTPIRETVTKDGLLQSERTWFDGTQSVVIQYQYQGGRLASWTDARGYSWGNVHDEVRGWHLGMELLGGPDVSEPRAVQTFGELDAEGKPHVITDQDGLVTRIRYDAFGRAVEWTRGDDVERVELDANGAERRRTFGRSGRHIIQTQVDALGRPVVRWNGSQETPPGGVGGDVVILDRTRYDGAGRVIERLDVVSGLKETFTYADVFGRLTRHVREVQSAGATLQMEETRTYADADARMVVDIARTIETPEGGQRTEQRTLTLDVAGRVLETREPVPGAGTAVHTFTYDARGNLLRHVPPRGGATSRTYDVQGRLLTMLEPGGVVTRFTYDPAGAVIAKEGPHEHEQWSHTYDAFGRLTKRKLAATPSVDAATWSYAHLADGEVVETDPRGFQTRRRLNALGQVESESREVAQDELVTEYTYDGPWLASAITELGGTWRHEIRRESYDDLGRARTEVEEWSDAGLSYEYTTTTIWNGTRSANITQRWNSGGLPTITRSSELELDSLGNPVRRAQGGLEDAWRYDAAGLLTGIQPAGVRTPRTYTYEQGYLTTETFGPETTAYTYFVDGRLQSTVEPSSRVRAFEYDERGLVSKETYGTGSEVVTTRYTYDAGGNRKTVTHGVQEPGIWTYDYGPLGELTSVTQPGGLGVFTYSYFPDRKLKGVTPPEGSGTAAQSFDYDALGREVLRVRGSSKWATDWSGGSGTTINTGAAGVGDTVTKLLDGRGRLAKATFGMGPNSTVLGDPVASDLNGGVYAYNGIDQLVSALEVRNSGDVTNGYTYDARNRPERVERGNHIVEYAYNDVGERSVHVTSTSGTSSYTFDVLDRLSQVQSSQGPAAAVHWEPGGDRVQAIAGSDVFERYCHDGVGRLASVTGATSDFGCGAGNVEPVFTRFAYSYDEHGNRTEERSVEGGFDAVTTYGYDLAGRLTGVRYPEGRGVLYRLAPDGTRLGEKVLSSYSGGLGPYAFPLAFPDLSHLEYTPDVGTGGLSIRDLSTAEQPASVITVDSAGQVVRKTESTGVTGFHWDPSGRLTKVSRDGSSVIARYVYDHGGLRRSSTTQDGVSEYIWSGEELIEEGLTSGAGLLHLIGPAGIVGVGGERVFRDALGSAVARLLPSGDVRVFQFDAWGKYRGVERPGVDESSISYTGHAYDSAASLIYAQQRWLDTGGGRFLSADPIGVGSYLPSPIGINPWLYANGSPLVYFDPDGRSGVREYFWRSVEGGNRQLRPIDPAMPSVVPSHRRVPELQVYEPPVELSPFMKQWYQSLLPPVATLSDGRRMSVYETEDDVAARRQRQSVEFGIRAVDGGSRFALKVSAEVAAVEVGGVFFRWLGRVLGKAVSESAGAIRVARRTKGVAHRAAGDADLAAYAAENYAVPADVVSRAERVNAAVAGSVEGAAPAMTTALASPWPPNRGFFGTPTNLTLQPGTRIDRYGVEFGTFVSPVGISFEQRALHPSAVNYPYSVYEVVRPLGVQAGPAAPWFGYRGMGTQYELPERVVDLVEAGVLRRVSGAD